MSEKIKVVYIVGSGHSGSTLLERILGSSSNAISVGELKALRYHIEKRNFKKIDVKKNFSCICGKELTDCVFWSGVVKAVDPKKLFPYKSGKIDTIKKAHFPQKKFKIFEDYALYQNILSQAKKQKDGVEFIIESSKDLNRLMYLNSLEGLDIKVIHLVRDGRAVVNSHRRRGVNWIKAYLTWMFENHLIGVYLKKLEKKSKIRISYDLFAQNPEKYLKEINERFGLAIDLDSYIDDVNKEEMHTFSGNRMRFKELDEIRYDQSWRQKMPKFEQLVLGFLTYLPNKFWIYYVE